MPPLGLPTPKPSQLDDLLRATWRFVDGFVEGFFKTIGDAVRDLFTPPFTGEDVPTLIVGVLAVAGFVGLMRGWWSVLTRED